MHKKFEIDGTKIEDGCQSWRKLVTHNSKSNLPLDTNKQCVNKLFLKNLTYANKRFCWQLTVDCIIGIILTLDALITMRKYHKKPKRTVKMINDEWNYELNL